LDGGKSTKSDCGEAKSGSRAGREAWGAGEGCHVVGWEAVVSDVKSTVVEVWEELELHEAGL